MKYGLRLAGVNLKRWGAHSTRSAATSYVESRGVGLSDIPKTADRAFDVFIKQKPLAPHHCLPVLPFRTV